MVMVMKLIHNKNIHNKRKINPQLIFKYAK
jgi:hypothetical protein